LGYNRRAEVTFHEEKAIAHNLERLGDWFQLASVFCLFAELIFFNRLVARLNSARPLDQGQPPIRRTPFQRFREYRQVYKNNDLPRVCMFWLMGFMILQTASVVRWILF